MTTEYLGTFAQRLIGAQRRQARIPVRGSHDSVPLSSSQQRIYFLCRLAPSATNWQVLRRLVVRGELDLDAVVVALRTVQERHAALRTRLVLEDGDLRQVVVEPTIDPVIHDLSETPPEEREARIAALDARHARAFDLHAEPFVRIDIARIGLEHHLLWLTVHHIVCDGVSMRIILRDLDELYTARIEGREPALPTVPITYGDYVAWEQARLESPEHVTDLHYWCDQLRGVAPLALPYDLSSTAQGAPRGAKWYFEIDAALRTKLERLGTQIDVTPFVLYVAAFKLVLAQYVGSDDIAVATPAANRFQRETRDLVGQFFNTLVLRTNLEGVATFADLLRREREVVLNGLAHQHVPYDEVTRAVRAERGVPLFNVLVNPPTSRVAPISLAALEVVQARREIEDAEADLSLDFLPHVENQEDNRVRAALSYDRDRLSADLVERIGRQFLRILGLVVEAPDQPLADLDLLSPEDHAHLAAWNDTAAPFPRDTCLHHLFEAQVDRTPNAPALVFESAQLSYADLDVRANQLAHHLRTLGVGPDVRVGVFAERSLEMMVAIYAVLKAGGAYVPLDPTYPAARLGFMVEDADVAVVLTQAHLERALPAHHARVVRVDQDWPVIASRPSTRLGATASPTDLAYIIFTSGSTGRPKGAMNEHRAVVNRLHWMQAAYPLDARDAVLQKTPFSFDVSVWELFWPLQVGAHLVLARPEGHKDPVYLVDLIHEAKITTLHFVPSMLAVFLETEGLDRCASVKRVITSGEALAPEHADRCLTHLPGAQLHNLYGPTEAAIDVTHWTAHAGARVVPIGQPISNIQIHIVDAHGDRVPIGVAGELMIGGIGVGRGYLNRPELTAEKFIPNPFGVDRLYRTGDLARWRSDGMIEYLGRIDHQVKLRGFRIELGEIEAVLARHPSVREVAVLLREDTPNDKLLVAYIVGRTLELDIEALRSHAATALPEYMVPGAFVVLAALPVSPNGKLDRKALPRPDRTSTTDYVAPRTPLELQLADIWRDLLRVERVGVHDDFFAIGGHSLLAIRLVSAVERHLGVKIPLRELFVDSTLGGLAARVGQARANDGAVDRPTLDASPTRRARLPAALRGVFKLNKLMTSDRFARHAWSTWIDGPLDLPSLERALAAMRVRHALLRTRFLDHDKGEVLEVLDPTDVERFALLERVDLSSLSEIDRLQADTEFHRSVSFRPLDVAHGEVMSVGLSRWSETRHRLSISLHNIVSDGESVAIYVNELCDLWRAFAADPERDPATILPPAALQYHHLADYLQRLRESEAGHAQRVFWKARLDGIQPLELPIDSPREEVDARREANAGVVAFRSASVERELPNEILTAIERIAEGQRATVMSTLIAAMAGYLSQRTSQRDLAFITRLSHRYMPGLERALGFLVNPILLRVSTEGAPAFSELVARTHTTVIDAFDHGECDLFELAPYSAFRFCLVYLPAAQRGDGSLPLPDGTIATRAPHPSASADIQIGYDLVLWLKHLDDRVQLQLAYNLELFRDTTAAAFLEGYVRHITAACMET